MGVTGPAARLLEDFSATFEDLPVGMSLVSCEGRLLRANSALCELLGRHEGELLGADLASHLHPNDRERLGRALHELVSGRTSSRQDEFRYAGPHGRDVHVSVLSTAVRDGHGDVALVVEQVVDRSQEHRDATRLEAASARAAALVELSDRLADAGTSTEQICALAVEALHRVLRGSVTSWLADPADGVTLEAVASRRDDPLAAEELRRLYAQVPVRLDGSYFSQACRAGRPVVVERPWAPPEPGPAMPEYSAWLAAHPLRVLLLAPLQREGRTLGVLGASRDADGPGFAPEDVAFAGQVARRLTAALADRQLLALERSTARRERAVAEVTRRCDEAIDRPAGLLDAAARAVGAELAGVCAVWLLDPDDAGHLGRGAVIHPDAAADAVLSRYLASASPSPDQGAVLLPRVLSEGRVHVVGRDHTSALLSSVEGLAEHAELLAVEALYAVPLVARGQTVGLLVVARTHERLSADDRRLVDALAGRLALAVDNAALLAAARTSRSRAGALVEHCSDLLLLADRTGAVRYASPAAARTFGREPGPDLLAAVVPEDRARVLDAWRAMVASPGPSAPVEARMHDLQGRMRRLSAVANNLLHDPAVDGIVLTVRDVTEEREAGARLAERARQQALLAALGTTALNAPLEELYAVAGQAVAQALESATSGVMKLLDDGDWLVLGVSEPAYAGLRIQAPPTSGLAVLTASGAPVVVADYLVPGQVDEPEMVERFGLRSGVMVPVQVQGRLWGAVTAHSEQAHRWSAVDVDFLQTLAAVVSAAVERAAFAERVLHQASTDDLTGLPNRVHLSEHLGDVLTHPDSARSAALLLLDLDDFKDVNDSLGHGAGDQVLAQLGRRLEDAVGRQSTVTRLGGDEFALVLSGDSAHDSAVRIAEQVVRAVGEPFALPGLDITLSGSIGIALAPQHGTDAGQLLQSADMAMYRAKGERSGWALFDSELDSRRAERLALLSQLRVALSAGQLELHYQPLVDMATEQVVEVEALVRWNHPERGLLLPDAFLPMAEQTDLVHGLTRYVVRAAAQQGRAWRSRGWAGTVAVNVSALALRSPDGIDALRTELLQGEGTLTVELTESALVDERARKAVQELAGAGIRCSVDDFGTGYSSLSYLQSLPVSRLKLDRAFNRSVDREQRDAAIVGGVVDIAHALGMDVVAEGVETRAVADRLRGLGVDVAQGWLYGRPQPASALRLA